MDDKAGRGQLDSVLRDRPGTIGAGNNVLLFPLIPIHRDGPIDVQPIDQYQFVLLGEALESVKRASRGPWEHVPWATRVATARIERALGGDPVPIKFSRDSGERLAGKIRELEAKALAKEGEQKREDVDFGDFYEVYNAIEAFEHTLAAELKGCASYFVPKRGIYDTADLIDRAEQHIPQELHNWIPALALSEFQEAGRCLAFNLPSASGFRVARAVEAMLIGYAGLFYVTLDPEKDRMGAYVNALEKTDRQIKPDPKTLRTIKDIKDFDRNPLMHPRAVLTDVQALSLFSLGHSAITAMVIEMRDKGDAPKQEPLPLSSPETSVGNALLNVSRGLFSEGAKSSDAQEAPRSKAKRATSR